MLQLDFVGTVLTADLGTLVVKSDYLLEKFLHRVVAFKSLGLHPIKVILSKLSQAYQVLCVLFQKLEELCSLFFNTTNFEALVLDGLELQSLKYMYQSQIKHEAPDHVMLAVLTEFKNKEALKEVLKQSLVLEATLCLKLTFLCADFKSIVSEVRVGDELLAPLGDVLV